MKAVKSKLLAPTMQICNIFKNSIKTVSSISGCSEESSPTDKIMTFSGKEILIKAYSGGPYLVQVKQDDNIIYHKTFALVVIEEIKELRLPTLNTVLAELIKLKD